MVAGAVADRHLPGDRALVQIVRGHATVRRLHETQPLDRRQRQPSLVAVLQVAPRGILFDQVHDEGTRNRRHVQHLCVGIPCRAAVVGAATVAGQLNRAALGGREENGAAVEIVQKLERLCVKLGREVDHVVVGHPLPFECRRPGGEGLRG